MLFLSYDGVNNDWYNNQYGKVLPGGDVMDFSIFQNLSTIKLLLVYWIY